MSAFFDLIQQDPIVSRVKLIVEPWDVGEGGFQVGNFPPLWSEWNGRYRDTVRDFWRGEDRTMGEFASRLTDRSDLYESDSRHPGASINFVTAHDGLTLADLVSYNEKHNEANGEDDKDGESNNRSWNGDAEGPTDDKHVIALRRRQQRNLLSTVLLIALRRDHPVLRRRRWFTGRSIRGSETHDIAWLNPDGEGMGDSDWNLGYAKAFGLLLHGEDIPWPGPSGELVTDERLLLLFNAHHEAIEWTIPGEPWGDRWRVVLDTADEAEPADNEDAWRMFDQTHPVEARSVVVLSSAESER